MTAFLIHRYIQFPNVMDRWQTILGFLGLSGPVGCLISSTIGTTTLFLVGTLPKEQYPLNWGIWWLGDIIGIFSIFIIFLAWTAEPEKIWKRRRVGIKVQCDSMEPACSRCWVISNASEEISESRLRCGDSVFA